MSVVLLEEWMRDGMHVDESIIRERLSIVHVVPNRRMQIVHLFDIQFVVRELLFAEDAT
jgi:hypothetical protein